MARFRQRYYFFRNIHKITCPLLGETDTFLIGYSTLAIIPCGICRPTHMIMYCGAKTALQYESDIRRNYLESFPVSFPPDSPELLTLVEGEPPSTLLIL